MMTRLSEALSQTSAPMQPWRVRLHLTAVDPMYELGSPFRWLSFLESCTAQPLPCNIFQTLLAEITP
jgi:hypothetical protein